jgi:integrase
MKKVWYRAAESNWYVTLKENGRRRQILLVKAPGTREGRKLAEAKLIEELAARKHQEDLPSVPSWMLVENILNGFLKHSLAEHEPKTYRWYKGLFGTFLPTYGKLRVTQIAKKHVQAWVKARGYNPTSQNRAIGALKRAFQWAFEEEHISRNPIGHLRKPKSLVRERILTHEERQLILTSIRGQAFRDFVRAMSLTGCRPGEIARLRKEDIDLGRGLWIFNKHKTVKKTGRPRIIYLCAEALELTKALFAKCTDDGPIFRNSRGQPWSGNAIRIRFRNLRRKHPELKGVIAYTYRASFATDALEAGVPDASVAALLGHTNTDTLHRFYARLSQKVDHLKAAAQRATQPPETGGSQRGISA